MRWLMAWATGNLGHAAYYRGNFAAARAHYERSLALGREGGDKRVIAERLECRAWVSAEQAQIARAVRLFGAAQALPEAIGAPMPPANRAEYDRSVAAARTRLGEAAFGALWREGRALSLEDAMEQAMAADSGDGQFASGAIDLTQREHEVVRLVVQGLTNREIAETLVVSVRTAEAHITHLLNKLGLRSRAQLAVWAVQHGVVPAGRGDQSPVPG
jgi:DNA-binding NarL/FixJ family response regulator